MSSWKTKGKQETFRPKCHLFSLLTCNDSNFPATIQHFWLPHPDKSYSSHRVPGCGSWVDKRGQDMPSCGRSASRPDTHIVHRGRLWTTRPPLHPLDDPPASTLSMVVIGLKSTLLIRLPHLIELSLTYTVSKKLCISDGTLLNTRTPTSLTCLENDVQLA